MSRAVHVVDMLLIVGLIVYILLFVWIPVPGIQPLCVTSGSMEPEIKEGDMVYIRKCKEEDIVVGDIIAFETGNDQLVLHRVIELTAEGMVTKGDANDHDDFMPVKAQNVKGKLVLVLPEMGRWYQKVSALKTTELMIVYVVCKLTFSFFCCMRKRILF